MIESDETLVARVRAGDKAAFGLLVERHRALAMRLARRLLADRAEAEDVVQEACLQAFLGLDRLHTPERFGAWLCGIALNLGRMRLRMRRASFSIEDWDGGRLVEGFTWAEMLPTPEAAYEARELHALIVSVLTALPDAQQAAVRQYYWEGLSIAEIGLLAGVPAGTVKARLSRARQQMRAGLAGALAVQSRASEPEKEASQMVEVVVYDVFARFNQEQPTLAAIAPSPRIVLLKTRGGERALPIWIGPAEADAITVLLLEKQLPRPLTFQFVAGILSATGVALERVAVTRIQDNIYFATAWLRSADGQTHEVDARPSDAITLALQLKAPILADEAVLEQCGVDAQGLHDYLEQSQAKDEGRERAPAEEPGVMWGSVLEVVRANWPGP